MASCCNQTPALCSARPVFCECYCSDPQAACVQLLLKAGLAACDPDLTFCCFVKKPSGSVSVQGLTRDTSQLVTGLKALQAHVYKNAQVGAHGG